VVGRQNADIADSLQLRNVAMATNIFWDCISCKWPLTEDKDMRLSRKGSFVINHLWRWELLQTGDCQVGN